LENKRINIWRTNIKNLWTNIRFRCPSQHMRISLAFVLTNCFQQPFKKINLQHNFSQNTINFSVLEFLWINTVTNSLTICLKINFIEMHMQHPADYRAIVLTSWGEAPRRCPCNHKMSKKFKINLNHLKIIWKLNWFIF